MDSPLLLRPIVAVTLANAAGDVGRVSEFRQPSRSLISPCGRIGKQLVQDLSLGP